MEKPSKSPVSSLLCKEREAEISSSGEDQIPDPSLLSLISYSNSFSDSEDYVQLLLEKENTTSSLLTHGLHTIKIVRLQAVNYILETSELLGFHFQTAYLSITYLDRFLSQRTTLHGEKPWIMQLLSVGCLSLAAKLHESSSLKGLLSFQFQVKEIKRMELLILYTLDWNMGSITPFAYIPYFITILFTKTPPWITLNKIPELVKGIVKDVSLMGHYPSAIALAAVLLSMDQRLTTISLELKIKAMPCSRFLDLEDVSSCYFIMQQSESKTPDTCPISSKRKRLEFDDTEDQTLGLLDKK